jgi:hypothetical protein
MKAAAREMTTKPQLGMLPIENFLFNSGYNFATRLQEGQQILQKKGCGHLIHISDWVEKVNGRLVVRNAAGVIIKEARKIIYPGSNGDPY